MNLKILRRITQLATVVLLLLIPLLNKNGITILMGSLYSMSVGPLWITDPLSGLQVILTSLTDDTALLLSISLPIVLTLVLGRVFCGWICPQNFLSEIADYLRSKTGFKRLLKLNPSPMPRYVVLALMLALTLLLGFPVANLISAPGIISVQMSEFVLFGSAGFEIALLGAIIIFEIVVVRRAWCNYICPVGGLLGLFRLSKTLKVAWTKKADSCIGCGECSKACQLGLNPMGGKIYPLCHNCGDCISACERATGKNNPLSFRF